MRRVIYSFLTGLSFVFLSGCSERTVRDAGQEGPVKTIESESHFNEAVLGAEKPVLVDFWATWCPPCRKMNPIVSEVSVRYKDSLDVAKVDLDQNRKLAERFQIRAVPTFMVFYKGRVTAAFEGAMSMSSFNQWIEKSLTEIGMETPRVSK